MAIYKHDKYGYEVEIEDGATPEQVNAELRRKETEHIQANKRGLLARARQGMERGVAGAATGGMLGGPAGMAAGGIAGALGLLPEAVTGVGEGQLEGTPSALGGIVGTAAGGRLGGPIGATVGGTAGSFLGELGAQQAGAIEESPVTLAASALPIPASKGVRSAVTRLPGAGKGLRKAATPVWEAFEAGAREAGVAVEPKNLQAAIGQLEPETAAEMATGPMRNLLKKAQAVVDKGKHSVAAFRDEMAPLAARLRSMSATKGPELGHAKTIMKAFQQDLDEAIKSGDPALKGLYKQASKLSKQAATTEKLSRGATQWPIRIAMGGGGLMTGGLPGASIAFAPDIVKAGLESRQGTQMIVTMLEQGEDLDAIANALVQMGIRPLAQEGLSEEERPPWEQE